MKARALARAACGLLATAGLSGADKVEFFEARIRPLLATKCWTCHSSRAQQGGLRLDSLAGALRGGGRGPAITPGNPERSLLMRAVRHEGLEMPLGGKLADREVADLAAWIADGSVWPAPSGASASDGQPPETVEASEHWAFRPVRSANPPAVSDATWVQGEVDAFILSELERGGLRPARDADRRTLVRRISFDLTGLPPRPEQVESFVNDAGPDAYERLVDELLDSDRFGEHWARHWMDWVRYCESHGSQGDFSLPNAWRYRDYLIRAFNSDVPYDQMLLEYLAGDLLDQPRVNSQESLNESMLGTANLRMVEYGYVPVDALDDQVKVVDNQIDVLTKAFQGLTVSCARCHDHKFDPISQKDFYALYGILASSRHGIVTVDSPRRFDETRDRLGRLKRELQSDLAVAWSSDDWSLAKLLREAGAGLDAIDAEKEEVSDSAEGNSPVERLVALLRGDSIPDDDPLRAWLNLRAPGSQSLTDRWSLLKETWTERASDGRRALSRDFRLAWNLEGPEDARKWFASGPGMPSGTQDAGEFRILPTGDQILTRLLPAGYHSGLKSEKFGGILGSPRFRVSSDFISVRLSGSNYASVKLIVENYPIGDGGIHPARELTGGAPGWVRLDSSYRRGQMAHLELQTLDDRSRAFHFNPRKPERKASSDGRSSFGIAEVLFHDAEETPPEEPLAMLHCLSGNQAPATLSEFEQNLEHLARTAAEAWMAGSATPYQTAYLDWAVRRGLLPSRLSDLPALRSTVDAYRKAEDEVPIPRRAPGVLRGTSFDQPLFLRGDHSSPGQPVARRYLSFLGSSPYVAAGSGRLELASEIASAKNPLTTRVIVNRLWHHLFGRGIVRTVDNFGAMGDQPSHPELLDFLAARFAEEGWSIKKALRRLALSRSYRMSVEASEESRSRDPDNRLLQHQNMRRLPAESIRDAMLAASGDLDPAMYGPSINVYYVGKTEGGGEKGPLDGERRRSIYQAVRRNAQNPFLAVFDAPRPSTTRGRRDVTNIPAQSLALLNDPFVIEQAARWADRALADGAISVRDRATRMFRRALGRPPDRKETEQVMAALVAFARERGVREGQWLGSLDLWKDYAQSLFNLKQFIYLH